MRPSSGARAPLRSAWSRGGEQAELAVPEAHGRFVLCGALNGLTGKTIVCDDPKSNSAYTKTFLREVLSRVRGRSC